MDPLNMDVLGGLNEWDLSTGKEETMDKCIDPKSNTGVEFSDALTQVQPKVSNVQA